VDVLVDDARSILSRGREAIAAGYERQKEEHSTKIPPHDSGFAARLTYRKPVRNTGTIKGQDDLRPWPHQYKKVS
jgi:hypothetical protein